MSPFGFVFLSPINGVSLGLSFEALNLVTFGFVFWALKFCEFSFVLQIRNRDLEDHNQILYLFRF